MVSRFPTFILALLVAQNVNASASASAVGSGWVKTEQTEVRLISSARTLGEEGQLKLGLQFKLQPGWKVYWRSPGDAGFPPQLNWDGSRNMADASTSWPLPERFSVLGLETLGYKDEVVFPISVKTLSPYQGADLQLSVKYLTCNDICIPYDAEFSLSIPPGPNSPSSFVHLIDRYRATVPGDGTSHGLQVASVAAVENDVWTGLRINAVSSTPFITPDLFVEGAPGLAFGKPEVSLSSDKKRAVLDVPVDGLEYVEDDLGQTLNGRPFTVTLKDGMRSAENRLTAEAAPDAQAPNSGEGLTLLAVLGLAVIGGLILNLMPCVLPVLSIKLIGAVGHGGGDRRDVRLGFIASAAGIIFSFLILAGALVFVKSTGGAVGWGIQFQQPWFLIAMTAVVILFACNLWGFFEINPPRAIADFGEHAIHIHGMGGHFVQGAFATLLATPCSAPFLGTAVGFALARGPADIFAVFAALGLGLSLPYLLVAAAPSLATKLPKPGMWMVRLKQILGFALLATAIWLLSVLYTSAGPVNTMILTVIMAAIMPMTYFGKRFPLQKPKVTAVGAVLILGAILFPTTPRPLPEGSEQKAATDIPWQQFDVPAIGRKVSAGQVVLVDVTADWCITCQVNKSLVLSRDPVIDLLKDRTVEPIRADWTKPDDAIEIYLASFGRYGIPFNAVYGPGAPEGIALPELLTQDAVLEAIRKAQKG